MSEAIITNDRTIKSLRSHLDGFPENARIVFVDPSTGENKELVICCNFEHQVENNVVMLTSGFSLDTDKFGRTEAEIAADEARYSREAEGDFSNSPDGIYDPSYEVVDDDE